MVKIGVNNTLTPRQVRAGVKPTKGKNDDKSQMADYMKEYRTKEYKQEEKKRRFLKRIKEGMKPTKSSMKKYKLNIGEVNVIRKKYNHPELIDDTLLDITE